MPEAEAIAYAASCNPPRRAKRHSITSPTPIDTMPPIHQVAAANTAPTQSSKPVAILPKRSNNKAVPAIPDGGSESAQSPPAPTKRGRKPGPLSRSAREAQRRLNHSIIEKARRTKINDALATLKQLVPADHGQLKPTPNDTDEDDEDEEYKEGIKKLKKAGKKEEKEKEFKLEILIRTVSYMQELLKRVSVLEAGGQAPCQSCSTLQSRSNKRRHSEIDSDDEGVQHSAHTANRRRVERDILGSPTPNYIPPSPTQSNQMARSNERLPSIASWLLDSAIDPTLLTAKQAMSQQSYARTSPLYLPSPPSTHFEPVRPSHAPPALNLGPVASAAIMSTTTTTRTPEDESAASLLLQISVSSPPFRPLASSSSPKAVALPFGLPDPSKLNLYLDYRAGSHPAPGRAVQAQTPGSLLGLNHVRI